MKNWTDILVSPDTSILHAIEIIDAGTAKIALVVDQQGKLLGTVTDGDIRRGILKGISLEEEIYHVMNPNPITVRQNERQEMILAIMKLKKIHHVPILDDQGKVVDLKIYDDLVTSKKRDNWVVLMAGGLGSRLRPLTNEIPKPLLTVGKQPILQTIIENFIEHGFYKFYLSVNYKAEMIKEYFGDGSRWGIEIRYINETKKLGTAGSLSLLPEKPQEPLIVMNGDLLTKVDFQQLLKSHQDYQSQATMCVREFEYQVPYGVVKVDKEKLIDIEEKPVERYFVNAGIYVIEPDTLDLIPKDQFFDMPDLFKELIGLNCNIKVFPIREYWLDIGQMDDFNRANAEFMQMFESR